ncbi:MAG: MATE family efflux transporter [Oscillospiraceae bacterium]|jgi:putative MATE family efflux protein|nr:MATE family efflux transporter [Oscillospiraceae bacterium]
MTKINVARFFTAIYSCDNMVKPDIKVGEILPTREIYSRTLNMAIPATTETVLVGMMGMIDTIMVGTISAAAIAAVGITSQPRFFVLAVIAALNIGVTAIVARRKGEGNMASARSSLKQALILTILFSILISTFAYIFAYPLLSFSGAGNDIIDDAVMFFRITMLSIPFASLWMTIIAAQRGAGNTRISMKINLSANIIKVLFNYLLIGGNFGFPQMGIQGAAVATVIGFAVAFLMSVYSIIGKSSELNILSRSGWMFDKKTLSGFANVGGGALVEQLFMRFGFLMFVKVVAGLGTIALVTHHICMNIVMLSFGFAEGLGIASSALVGQNLGAKRPDMAMIYGKVCQRIAITMSSLMSVVFIFGRRGLIRIFTSEEEIITTGSYLILILAVITFAQMSQFVMAGALRGAGDAKYVAFVALVTVGILRPGLAWLFAYPMGMGLIGIWLAFLTDQIARLTLNITRFSKAKWTHIRL